MKKLLITGGIFSLLYGSLQAQTCSGLDSIIVEKYYVSDVADKAVDATGGILPNNSVTYRIFVDMKPGYKFQAAYGVDVSPTGSRNAGDHELRIATTTLFFNNEDRGDITPGFTKSQAANNTVMLDSWLSVGAAASSQFGVMKIEDDGVNNQVNSNGVLLNNNAAAGIPLTTQDGFLAGSPESVTMVGISSESQVFYNQNDGTNGPVFSTYNGSWASLNGSVGPTSTNRVLIAQITTNGTFSFKLNIQLGTPTAGVSENWVANNPVGNECTHSTLIYLDSLGTTKIAPIKAQAGAFSVYPNPVTDVVNLAINNSTSSDNNSYAIYSIDGRIVTSKHIGSVNSSYVEKIDMSGYAPGLYFIEMTIDGTKETKKFIKN